jgi:hypothetical protein
VTPNVDTAVAKLREAIALHEKHMNGTAPTTGPAGEKSQMAMMDMMKAALKALTQSGAHAALLSNPAEYAARPGGMKGM